MDVTSPGTLSLLDELDNLASSMASPSQPAAAAGHASGPEPQTAATLFDQMDELASSTTPSSAPSAPASAPAVADSGGGDDLGSLMSAFSEDLSPTAADGGADGGAAAEPAPAGGGDLGDLLSAFGEELEPVLALSPEPPAPATAAAPASAKPSSLLAELDAVTAAAAAEEEFCDAATRRYNSDGERITEEEWQAAQAAAAAEPEPEQEQEPEPTAEQLRSTLFSFYMAHVPEKSREGVEAILEKYAGREAILLTKVRKKYLKPEAPRSPNAILTAFAAGSASGAEEGTPPEHPINTESDWIKYVGSPAFDGAGMKLDRQYYRHRRTEELTLNAPGEWVREIRHEKDLERFEMDWRRAGGKLPEKEGWGSWIKRGVVDTTSAVVEASVGLVAPVLEPAAAAAVSPEKDSWGSWIKKGVVGGAAEPKREAPMLGVESSMDRLVGKFAAADATTSNTSVTRGDLTKKTASIENMMVQAPPASPVTPRSPAIVEEVDGEHDE